MPSPRDLLHRLFEYIGEQLKDIDPRGYRLSSHPGFLRRRGDLAGLPGIDFDIQVEGDLRGCVSRGWKLTHRRQSQSVIAVSFGSAMTPMVQRQASTKLIFRIGSPRLQRTSRQQSAKNSKRAGEVPPSVQSRNTRSCGTLGRSARSPDERPSACTATCSARVQTCTSASTRPWWGHTLYLRGAPLGSF